MYRKVTEKIGLTVLLALLSSIGIAQSYTPLPDSGGHWVNEYSEVTDYWACIREYVVEYCSSGEDTTIGSKNYFKLDTCQGGYEGALRNSNGKVFFVPKDSSSEHLIYDFTVNEGDTVKNVIDGFSSSYSLRDYPVEQVDTVQINGSDRRKIILEGSQWIEGIGNLKGLLWPSFMILGHGVCFELYCMSDQDTSLYGPNCPIGIGIEEASKDSKKLNLFPNPASGKQVTIDLSSSTGEIHYQILDAKGKKVKADHLLPPNTINISDLDKGIYLVRVVIAREGVVTKRLVVK